MKNYWHPKPAAEHTDYKVVHVGSNMYVLVPLNRAAKKNVQDGVSEEAQWWGGGVVVEARYLDDLVSQLRDEGWEVK